MVAGRLRDHQLPDKQSRKGGDDGSRAGFFQDTDTERPQGKDGAGCDADRSSRNPDRKIRRMKGTLQHIKGPDYANDIGAAA